MDNYGDFKFEGLVENCGHYVLTIAVGGFKEKKIQVDLVGSVYLGEIHL